MSLSRITTLSIFILFLILWPTLACTDFQEGQDAYDSGTYEAALNEWFSLVKQGDARAQTQLGVLYANGQGIPQVNVAIPC